LPRVARDAVRLAVEPLARARRPAGRAGRAAAAAALGPGGVPRERPAGRRCAPGRAGGGLDPGGGRGRAGGRRRRRRGRRGGGARGAALRARARAALGAYAPYLERLALQREAPQLLLTLAIGWLRPGTAPPLGPLLVRLAEAIGADA